jgi:plasmid stabilization system protein ParE
MRVVWTLPALRDARRLRAFLAEKNPEAASRAIATIRARAKDLSKFPRAGRVVPGVMPELRELLVLFGNGGYVLRYRNDADVIAILAVRHGRERGFQPLG